MTTPRFVICSGAALTLRHITEPLPHGHYVTSCSRRRASSRMNRSSVPAT